MKKQVAQEETGFCILQPTQEESLRLTASLPVNNCHSPSEKKVK